jgi:hypothetical protein
VEAAVACERSDELHRYEEGTAGYTVVSLVGSCFDSSMPVKASATLGL